MQDIKRTIDRLIKVVPNLNIMLSPIREKAEKYPQHRMSYWKQVLEILNSSNLSKNEDIRRILVSTSPKPRAFKHSFADMGPHEYMIGTIPENLSDRLKRYDILGVRLGKMKFEANATNNTELFAYVSKREFQLQIKIQKIWYELRNHFNLWNINTPKLTIRRKDNVLIITGLRENAGSSPFGPMNFLKMLGIDPTAPTPPPPPEDE